MPSATKEREKPVPDDEAGDDDAKQPIKRVASSNSNGGYFSVYKSGQGYWTRMCTAGGAVLVAGLIANFIWEYVGIWVPYLNQDAHRGPKIAIVAAVFFAICAFAWTLINKPRNADFLIATDSEMKKVNWTSRAELIGSTRVVILFMFFIAFLLFGIDILFGYIFYFCKVLQSPPL